MGTFSLSKAIQQAPAENRNMKRVKELLQDIKWFAVALCAGLVAVVVWAVVAWAFGLPSSQSHSLIAGISGAAIAAVGSFSAINFGEWKKVIYGLGVSIIVGALLGFIMGWITPLLGL